MTIKFHANRYNHHEPAHWRMTRCGSQRLLAAIARAHPERVTTVKEAR